jgi:large subunit ribosomal protein L10
MNDNSTPYGVQKNGGEIYMPSEKILAEKKKIVEDMTGKLKSKAGVFVDYKGITVIEDTEMRVKLREANVDYSVIKNSLMRFAVKNVGFEELEKILVGTTSLAISNEDPIAPARIIKEYADKLPDYFNIKAGFMDGRVLSLDEVNSIAGIPELPVLQAQLLGTMLAPITSLAIVIKAIAEKGGAPADVEVKADTKPEPAPEAESAPAEEVTPEAEAVQTEEPPTEAELAEEAPSVVEKPEAPVAEASSEAVEEKPKDAAKPAAPKKTAASKDSGSKPSKAPAKPKVKAADKDETPTE